MFKLFPDRADDLINAAALDDSGRTELNYRTRPLTSDQETRLTLLIVGASPLAIVLLGMVVEFLVAAAPGLRHVAAAAVATWGAWYAWRRLTGALQTHDAVMGLVLAAACLSGLAWHGALAIGGDLLRWGLVATWGTCCLIARQVAAWWLVGPAVDHERMERWRPYVPRLIPRTWSEVCPELLAYVASPGLILGAWKLSLGILLMSGAGNWFWPVCFVAAALAVWTACHAAAIPILPFPPPDATLRAAWKAIVVFVTYDAYQIPAAGVFRFPTRWLRRPRARWGLLAVVMGLVAFGFGTLCPRPSEAWLSGGSAVRQLAANVILMGVAGPVVLLTTLWLTAGALLARFERELSVHGEGKTDWDTYVERILNSDDELESEHFFVGVSETSDYPVLVHRPIFDQHGHVLGDSGAAKSSLSVVNLATQAIARGDSTVVVIDLKGDMAQFEGCRREAARTRKLRFRWLCNEVGKTTFAFNPLQQSHHKAMSLEQRTQELLQGMSLDHGLAYGASYFTAMNEIVLRNVLGASGARSFADLSPLLADRDWYGTIGHEDDWKQARHLSALVSRLGGSALLNATRRAFPGRPEVIDQALDAANIFEEPQVVYLWLRSAAEPTNAPTIARLFLWSMFSAACQRPLDGNRVYFFIDEMQQIISDGMKLIFEQFRDMGGTIIGAHQTASQLRRQGTDLGDTVESCTAVKQIFRASDLMSLERLEKLSGVTEAATPSWHQPYERGAGDLTARYDEIYAEEGLVRVSREERSRYNREAIQAISARRTSSLIRFTFGSGYTQFAGRSIPISSLYHISFDEYRRRRKAKWPVHPGAFTVELPAEEGSVVATPPSAAIAAAEADFGAEFESRGRPAIMDEPRDLTEGNP